MRPQHLLQGLLTVQHTRACSGHHTHLPCLVRFLLAARRPSACRSPSARRTSSLPVFCSVQHATANLPRVDWLTCACAGHRTPVHNLDIICGPARSIRPSCCLQGIRPAQPQDLDAIQGLLEPLEREGIVRRRGRTELLNMLHNFTVVERENQVGAADLSKQEPASSNAAASASLRWQPCGGPLSLL